MFFFLARRFIFGVVLLGFLLGFNAASHPQTMIQAGTDRAAPGRMLQSWGSFLRKDQEKIKNLSCVCPVVTGTEPQKGLRVTARPRTGLALGYDTILPKKTPLIFSNPALYPPGFSVWGLCAEGRRVFIPGRTWNLSWNEICPPRPRGCDACRDSKVKLQILILRSPSLVVCDSQPRVIPPHFEPWFCCVSASSN